MHLRDFLQPSAVRPCLRASSRDDALAELVDVLGIPGRRGEAVVRILRRREQLGSTAIGRGIAIPHGRSLAVSRLRLGFGTRPGGLEFGAIDGRPVHALFVILAPPVEVANQYLPVLGRIAQFAREPDVPERLRTIDSAEALYALFTEKGV
jgi:nitrogen PTS system EIIA component